MTAPNFFLIGAPKCGTTALAHYLGEHPRIFMPPLKEPNFWSNDIPLPTGDVITTYPRTLPEYLQLFTPAQAEHVAVGEASTSYVWSQVAVRRILAFQPQAKFIAMVRNPVELVHALHATEVYFLNEPESDFETAWRRCESRASHDARERSARLDYRRIASLGTHIERLFCEAPAAQCHVIVYDDFVADPRRCYEDVLSFLGVSSDGRTEFPVINSAKEHRFGFVPRLVMQPPRWLRPGLQHLARPLLRLLGLRNLREALLMRFSVKRPRRKLSSRLSAELAQQFAAEVELLSQVLDRDLSHWLTHDGQPSVTPAIEAASELLCATTGGEA